MKPILIHYRSRKLHEDDFVFIKTLIDNLYLRGRSYISREFYKNWNWVQPHGKLKTYAARYLFLRLEEQGLVALPPRIHPKNNLKPKVLDRMPLFIKKTLAGDITEYETPAIPVVKDQQENYLLGYLFHHYHDLGCSRLAGKHLRYFVCTGRQVIVCLVLIQA